MFSEQTMCKTITTAITAQVYGVQQKEGEYILPEL